jgi:hypothetical protein
VTRADPNEESSDMTEAEWLAGNDPGWMLLHLISVRPRPVRARRRRARKLRLAVCACCRRVSCHWGDPRIPKAVLVAERYADGLAGEGERLATLALAAEALGGSDWKTARVARCAWRCLADDDEALAAYPDAMESAAWATAGPEESARFATATDPAGFPHYAAERRAQVPLLRCHFGNPFRPAAMNPAWLAWNGGAVGGLAQAAYEERDPEQGALDPTRLAILADALEEAGCTDAELLGHLRGSGLHFRGCWPVDLLTGRS